MLEVYDDSETTRTLTTRPRGRLPPLESTSVSHSALTSSGLVNTQDIIQCHLSSHTTVSELGCYSGKCREDWDQALMLSAAGLSPFLYANWYPRREESQPVNAAAGGD